MYTRPGLGAGTAPETVETAGPGPEFLGFLLTLAIGAALNAALGS